MLALLNWRKTFVYPHLYISSRGGYLIAFVIGCTAQHNRFPCLSHQDHPNIIKIYEFYQDQRYFYIVTELCTGGELFDKIMEEKLFDEQKAAETIRQVLQAVNYCHKNNIVHRDLKPENILYESRQPNALLKVVDFGTSIAYDPTIKMN